MLVLQRLHGGASLEAAVLELLRGLPAGFWPNPCKRVRQWQENGVDPSSNTGGYNLARQALPLSVVQKTCDRIYQQLVRQVDPATGPERGSTVLLDGTTIRTAHTPTLCKRYPPGSNQHGDSHWPLLRVVVAHDLQTALAMRPEWGPMRGPEAVSEQELVERLIDRLPQEATLLGDRNMGVFSVAYAATERRRPVVLRLSTSRAQRLNGGELHDGIDQKVVWKPSKADRRSHPDLAADACVEGRLIVRKVQPSNGDAAFLLALFTTLVSPEPEIVKLYGQRWAIETDLRTLKSELRLDQITSSTPDMVAKEIEMGMAAYNLVRAMICLAAQQSGIPPRGYRFTKVRRILEIFGPALAAASNEREAKRIFDQMMKYIQQSKLPKRKRKRPSYPRAIWGSGGKFPNRRT
jgi:Transposase DDE domain